MSDNGTTEENIELLAVEDEMVDAYLTYAMSVIVGRAIPDARDGLKPVHRRILWGMSEDKVIYRGPFRKSARVVGSVMGRYHPHGDQAIYDALARLTQSFSLRYPLIQGQGNFGSIDGDQPAAMRYTECRLNRLSDELLREHDEDTIDFRPNFDRSLKEPLVLPSKIPNLLLNGSVGISVGMATNIPPHNLRELIDAIIYLVDNPEASVSNLMQFVKGPDFPTGALIHGAAGIHQAYQTGRGKIKVRARTEFIEDKKTSRIIVTEIPYQVNKSNLVKQIADQASNNPHIKGVKDLSDMDHTISVEIDLKPGSEPQAVLNQLFKSTDLQTTFGIINLALVDGKPRVLDLKTILEVFVKHRKEVIIRRTRYRLKKAQERLHILDGFLIALDHIEEIVRIIRSSSSDEEIREKFSKSENLKVLTLIQITAILNLRLRRLSRLESDKLKVEYDELQIKVTRYQNILGNPEEVLKIIKTESREIKEQFGDDRKTTIVTETDDGYIDIDSTRMEDMVVEEKVVIFMTKMGYVTIQPLSLYKAQHRGGKGVYAIDLREDDFIRDIRVSSNKNHLLLFTSKAKVYSLRVYQIPVTTRRSKGISIRNRVPLEADEEINAWVTVRFFNSGYLVSATMNGMIKKTPLSQYRRVNKNGKYAMRLREGDKPIGVAITNGKNQIVLGTRLGKAIRFSETHVRPTGRATFGVHGLRLRENDVVIAMEIPRPHSLLLTVSERGLGKRTAFDRYPLRRRYGMGVINTRINEKTGPIVDIRTVFEGDQLLIINKKGKIIRAPVSQIRITGRGATGVRLMRFEEDDSVRAIGRILSEEGTSIIELDQEEAENGNSVDVPLEEDLPSNQDNNIDENENLDELDEETSEDELDEETSEDELDEETSEDELEEDSN